VPKASRTELGAVFEALKRILKPYERNLPVSQDEPGRYHLGMKSAAHKGKPIFVVGVVLNKNYVSYHLMPLYVVPRGLGISPALKRRMQGKACFNFTSVDDALFRELSVLTKNGIAAFKAFALRNG